MGLYSPQQGKISRKSLTEEREISLCTGAGQETKVGISDIVNGKVQKADVENEK